MSQTQAIKRYLYEYGSITPIEALQEFGCFRLAARIQELRRFGVPIRTDKERSGTSTYARYTLTETKT